MSVVLLKMTMKLKTKLSRFLGKWRDLCTVSLHLVYLGLAVNFYSWPSMPTTITICVSECFLNHFKEATSSALRPTPERERERERNSPGRGLVWKFFWMSYHNLTIVVVEIPLETRKGENQTLLPCTRLLLIYSPQENKLLEFIFK